MTPGVRFSAAGNELAACW